MAKPVREVEMLHGHMINVNAELEGREAEVQSMKEEINRFWKTGMSKG